MPVLTSAALERLVEAVPPDGVFVASLGRVAVEMDRLRSDQTLFLDSLGDVVPVAVGIALARPALPVTAIDTDGSFLMNLSVLPAMGEVLPRLPALTVWIVDNGRYESAGNLPSRGAPLAWEPLFAAVGLECRVVSRPDDVRPVPGAVVVLDTSGDVSTAPAATRSRDGIETSYTIERLIADLSGAPRRLPATKS